MPPILTVPGYTNSGPRHWQSLWEAELPNVRRVEQADWDHPRRIDWVAALDAAIANAGAPAILVAHSLGSLAVVHWAQTHRRPVAAALLVAPPDVEAADSLEALRDFAPIPLRPLRFRSMIVASANDTFSSVARSRTFAQAWGSEWVCVGAAGHINTASGHGVWPEGKALLERLIGSPR